MPAPKSMFAAMLAKIRRVPYGKVATYGDVAYAAGFPGSARQVVWALNSKHDAPWHRILGAGGKILLSGENGFEQRMRLRSEGVEFIGLRVDMKQHQHSFFGKRPKDKKSSHSKRKLLKKTASAKANMKSGNRSTSSKATSKSTRPR